MLLEVLKRKCKVESLPNGNLQVLCCQHELFVRISVKKNRSIFANRVNKSIEMLHQTQSTLWEEVNEVNHKNIKMKENVWKAMDVMGLHELEIQRKSQNN